MHLHCLVNVNKFTSISANLLTDQFLINLGHCSAMACTVMLYVAVAECPLGL